MSAEVDFWSWGVPDLKTYLRVRGVSCSILRKRDLVRLCSVALELKLEILNDIPDDYRDLNQARRTVLINGKSSVLNDVATIDTWSSTLTAIPDIEQCDILIYFLNSCGWSEDRLKNYKHDSGYKLYLANHINDVLMSSIQNTDYLYIKATCVPETRQRADPYNVWILLRSSGEIKSGGCTCVASSEQKQKGRVSFSSQPEVETYSQDRGSNESVNLDYMDSDEESCAALIRRSDKFSLYNFDEIDKFNMCVETEGEIVNNLTNEQAHPSDIQIVNTAAVEDFAQVCLSDCMNPFNENTNRNNDIDALAEEFLTKENKKKKDKKKRGRKKGKTELLTNCSDSIYDKTEHTLKKTRRHGNQIYTDCLKSYSESNENVLKCYEDTNTTSQSPYSSFAADISHRNYTCNVVEDPAENLEKRQIITGLKLPYKSCLSLKPKTEGNKVNQKNKMTQKQSESPEICTHQIGMKTQSSKQNTITMKENDKITKQNPRVLRYSLRNSPAGTHLKEVTGQEMFDSDTSSLKQGHYQTRNGSNLQFLCSSNAFIPQTLSDQGKLKDVTPIQRNAANKCYYVTPEQMTDKTDPYTTPVMDDYVQQEAMRAIIKSPRKQKLGSKYISSTAVFQTFDNKANDRHCSKKARASLLEDYVDMECMNPAGDAGIKTLDKENLNSTPFKDNANMGLEMALGDNKTVDDDRDSDDSYQIQDAEYSELLMSDLGYDDEDDGVVDKINEHTGDILCQALQKLKQAARNSPVPSLGSSPRLLSPALSGISEFSNKSSSSSVTKSAVEYLGNRPEPISIKSMQQGHSSVTLEKDAAVKNPGLCHMFQDMTPPQRKSNIEGNRRVIASAKQETSSNFKNMFREQAIFD